MSSRCMWHLFFSCVSFPYWSTLVSLLVSRWARHLLWCSYKHAFNSVFNVTESREHPLINSFHSWLVHTWTCLLLTKHISRWWLSFLSLTSTLCWSIILCLVLSYAWHSFRSSSLHLLLFLWVFVKWEARFIFFFSTRSLLLLLISNFIFIILLLLLLFRLSLVWSWSCWLITTLILLLTLFNLSSKGSTTLSWWWWSFVLLVLLFLLIKLTS
jgi:hypothetical protein